MFGKKNNHSSFVISPPRVDEQSFLRVETGFLSSKSGSSLMEFLIVLAIMAIMGGVLFANQNKNKTQSDVDSAARNVVAQLRQLQNEALSGKAVGSVPVCQFGFSIANGSMTYQITYGCTNGSADGTFNLNSKKNVKAVSNNSFYFDSPRGEINPSGAQEIIIETNSSFGNRASVCVCGSGNIFEKKEASCGC